MKSKRLWIEIGALVIILVIVIAGVCVHNWWQSPGVHVLGNRARVEIYDTAYIFDITSGELREMADVVIHGELSGHSFEGYVDVVGHHIPLERMRSDGGSAGGSIKDHTIEIGYKGDNSHDFVMSNGSLSAVPQDDLVPWYDVTIDIDTGAYRIEVAMKDACVVFSAEDEQTATRRYNEYIEEITKEKT